MGGIMGGSVPSVQQMPTYQPAQADLSAQNAALFERIQRSRAYGTNQTRLAPSTPYMPGKGTMG